MARPKTPLTKRLWAKIQKAAPDNCWLWIGGTDQYGYGRIRGEDGIEIPAYHAVWLDTNGPLPPYHRIRHTCGNPSCCNPAHLELYRLKDNEW